MHIHARKRVLACEAMQRTTIHSDIYWEVPCLQLTLLDIWTFFLDFFFHARPDLRNSREFHLSTSLAYRVHSSNWFSIGNVVL